MAMTGLRKPSSVTGTFYLRHGKKIFDCLGTGIALILLWPVVLLVYVLLRVSIGAPVFFGQLRPGLLGKPFMLRKFRTMTDKRDRSGSLLPDEERTNRIGMLLRRTSLDELPELFNVLLGDMSLVGPRPLLMQYLDRYTPEQARRHYVRPGLTGWAQINGRNALTWEEKFRLDVWYVDHLSFRLDVYILAVTVWKVLRREGIGYEGFVSAPEFMGSSNDQRVVHERRPES